MSEVTLLYFDGCPSWQTADGPAGSPTLAQLREVLSSEDVPAPERTRR